MSLSWPLIRREYRLWSRRSGEVRIGFGWFTAKSMPATNVYIYLLLWELSFVIEWKEAPEK